MTETNAEIGFTSTFAIEGAANDFSATVAEVTSIQPPGWTRDAVDATHLQSPDGYKEFIAGMKEGGECTIGLNFVPSAVDALQAALEAGKGRYRITFPSGVTLTFTGICTAYEPGEITNDKMTATAKFKPTGKPVLAAAA